VSEVPVVSSDSDVGLVAVAVVESESRLAEAVGVAVAAVCSVAAVPVPEISDEDRGTGDEATTGALLRDGGTVAVGRGIVVGRLTAAAGFLAAAGAAFVFGFAVGCFGEGATGTLAGRWSEGEDLADEVAAGAGGADAGLRLGGAEGDGASFDEWEANPWATASRRESGTATVREGLRERFWSLSVPLVGDSGWISGSTLSGICLVKFPGGS